MKVYVKYKQWQQAWKDIPVMGRGKGEGCLESSSVLVHFHGEPATEIAFLLPY